MVEVLSTMLALSDVVPAAGGVGVIPPLWSADSAVALLTLTALEIVLGIDNIVFIAILCGRLPESQRDKARRLGLALAMFMRIGLLLLLGWVMALDKHGLFTIIGHTVTGKDLVLLLGGLFLMAKATFEIHHKIEGAGEKPTGAAAVASSFAGVIAQILMIDLVFSLDSVITAVGMAKRQEVMIAAVVIAVLVMLLFSGSIARFIDRHPTMKMLALSFLLLIGMMLVIEGTGGHVNKGYIYFAMAFSLGVEFLNLWVRNRQLKHLPGGPGAVRH
jgi:predicted tellurium resistance membrane protein TerC